MLKGQIMSNELAKLDKERGQAIIKKLNEQEVVPVTDLAYPQIKMGKDDCMFEVTLTGESVSELSGHIILKHNMRAYFPKDYGVGGDMPTCASSNGVVPDLGTEPEYGPCHKCKLKEWGTHRDKVKPACSESVMLYILLDGDEIPSVMRVRSTSLGRKSSLAKFETYLFMNKLVKTYPLVHVNLTLEATQFNNRKTSILIITPDATIAEDDPKLELISQCFEMLKDVNKRKETVQEATEPDVETEVADDSGDDIPF